MTIIARSSLSDSARMVEFSLCTNLVETPENSFKRSVHNCRG